MENRQEKKKVEETWGVEEELDLTPENKDNPENMKGLEGKSIYEKDEDMKHVDAIPIEDRKQEEIEENHNRMSKHDSSTTQKFPGADYAQNEETLEDEN
ncbi:MULTISPECIES: hypothetical protein [Bhargavaea]|uniref:DUF4025 domain-containing protein n=1 Tax=Bhargavaea changchunensis TaxID=2134037 RepID=A0ABW2N8G0_9BACL|nr:hypothetical protein [Bhargavaea sp. CC-171006]